MQEVDNILRILKESKIALGINESNKLKSLSDQTIHTATISQDPDNILIAVLIYSLSKIVEREKYREMPGWDKFYKTIQDYLQEIVEDLEENNIPKAEQSIKKTNQFLENLSGNLKDYIHDVIIKAKINKASKVYEHGLSLQKTAELLNVSLWELSQYVGQSNISNLKLGETIPVEKRIKIAEEIFEK